MDEIIGEVVDHLEKEQLRENTIVILQSDHGHSTESRTFGGGGNAGPYRGAKGCLFEGGIRVPSIISWPGGLPKGEVRAQMATGCDWLPTLSDLCDVPLPKRKLDGKSLSRVLRAKEEPSPHKKASTGNWVTSGQCAKVHGNFLATQRTTPTRHPLKTPTRSSWQISKRKSLKWITSLRSIQRRLNA